MENENYKSPEALAMRPRDIWVRETGEPISSPKDPKPPREALALKNRLRERINQFCKKPLQVSVRLGAFCTALDSFHKQRKRDGSLPMQARVGIALNMVDFMLTLADIEEKHLLDYATKYLTGMQDSFMSLVSIFDNTSEDKSSRFWSKTETVDTEGLNNPAFQANPGGRLLMVAITLVFGNLDGEKFKLTDRVSKTISHAKNNMKNVSEIASVAAEFIGLQGDRESEALSEATKHEEHLVAFLSLSKADQLRNLPKVDNYLRTVKAFIAYIAKEEKNTFKSASRRLEGQILKVTEATIALNQQQAELNTMRPEPVKLHIFGPPGGGKSTLMSDIVDDLCDRLNFPNPLTERYSLDSSNTHIPPYAGQRIAIYDEAFAGTKNDMVLPIFNNLATSTAFTVDGASLDTKAMTLRHEYFFSVSNFQKFTPPTNSEYVGTVANAINSRLYPIYVHYPKMGAHRDDGAGALGRRELCFHEVSIDDSMPSSGKGNLELQKCHQKCPQAGQKIEYDVLLDRLVRQRNAHMQRYNAKVEAHKQRMFTQTQSASGPRAVVLLHGRPGAGKTHLIDEIKASCSREALRKLVIFDDQLPDSEDLYCNWWDGCKGDEIAIVAANLEIQDRRMNLMVAKTGARKFSELHSRTLRRLPLVGPVKGSDKGDSILSTTRGMELKVKDFIARDPNKKEVSAPSIGAFLSRTQRTGKKFLTYIRELPELTDPIIVSIDRNGRRTLSGPQDAVYLEKLTKTVNILTNTPGTPDPHELTKWADTQLNNAGFTRDFRVNFEASKVIVQRCGGEWYVSGPSMPISSSREALICAGLSAEDKADESFDIARAFLTRRAQQLSLYFEKEKSLKLLGGLIIAGGLAMGVKSLFFGKDRAEAVDKEEETPATGELVLDGATVATLATIMSQSMDPEIKALLAKNPTKNHKKIVELNRKAEAGSMDAYNALRALQTPSYFQSLREENPSGAIFSKIALMNSIRDAKFQGQQDIVDRVAAHSKRTPLYEGVAIKAKPNQVFVTGTEGSLWGTIFHNRFGYAPSHCTRPHSDKVRVAFYLGERYLSGDAKIIRQVRERDHIFFALPKKMEDEKGNFHTVPPFKSLIKNHVASFDEIPEYGAFAFPEWIGGKLYMHHTAGHMNTSSEFVAGHHRTHHLILTLPGRKAITKDGDCGMPYLVTDEKQQAAAICGMHGFYSERGNYIGGPLITQLDLQWAADPVFQSSELSLVQIKLDGKTYDTVPIVADVLAEKPEGLPEIFPENERIKMLTYDKRVYTAGAPDKTSYSALVKQSPKEPATTPSIRDNSTFPKELVESFPLDAKGKHNRGIREYGKMVLDEKPAPPALKELLIGYVDEMREHFPPDTVRVLSTQEAITGVLGGPLGKIKGMDLTTSTGFTGKRYLGARKKGNLIYVNDEGYKKFKSGPPAQEFLRLLEEIEASPNYLALPVTGSLKDELLPKHKVEKDGKIRLFSNVDMLSLTLTKKYIGFVVGQMQNRLHLSNFTAGIVPGTDFHDMFLKLSKHPHIITYDFSKFDKRLPMCVLEGFTSTMEAIMADHYNEFEMMNARKCLHNLLHRIEVFEGHVFQIKGGTVSGEYWTNFINSGGHDLLFYTCVFTLFKEKFGRYPTWYEVSLNTVLYHHGDDGAASVSAEWGEFIDFFTIREQMKELFGLAITPAQKDDEPTKFTPPEKVTFLAHYFRRYGQKIVGVLQKSSLEKNFAYTRQHTPEHYEQVFVQGLEAAALHGKKYFDEKRKCALENAKIQNFNITLPSYRDVHAALMARQGQALIQVSLTDLEQEHKLIGLENTKLDKVDIESDIIFQVLENIRKEVNTTTKMKPLSGITIECKSCSRKGDVQFWKEHVSAHPDMLLQENKHKTRGTITFENGFAHFVEEWKKNNSIFDPEAHYEQVKSHKVSVDTCAKAFFGRTYPAHDVSKFSSEETLPYVLRWTWFLKAECWDDALQHHFANNPHHYEHFVTAENPTPDYPRAHWDEAIADSAGCILERNPAAQNSPIKALELAIKQWHEGKFLRFGPQNEEAIAHAEEVLKRLKADKTSCKRCPVKCKTEKKLINHVESAHPGATCPLCDSKPGHAEDCEVNMAYRCLKCVHYCNPNRQATVNHQGNCNGTGPAEIERFKDTIKFQMASFDARPTNMAVNESPAIEPPTFGNNPGVPDLLAAAPGYTSSWTDLLTQKIIFDVNTVTTSSVTDTVIARYVYGDLTAMQPYVAAFAEQHRYIHGPLNYHVKLFGSSNFIGSIMIGVVPDANNFTGGIRELQAFGNWESLSLSGMASKTMTINNADLAGYRPREVGDTTGAPGLIIMVEQPVQNAFGEGTTSMNIQTSMYMGMGSGFTYVKPIAADSLPAKRSTATPSSEIVDISSLASKYGLPSTIAVDGRFHYEIDEIAPTLGPRRINDPPLTVGTDQVAENGVEFPTLNIASSNAEAPDRDPYLRGALFSNRDVASGQEIMFRYLEGHIPALPYPDATTKFLSNDPVESIDEVDFSAVVDTRFEERSYLYSIGGRNFISTSVVTANASSDAGVSIKGMYQLGKDAFRDELAPVISAISLNPDNRLRLNLAGRKTFSFGHKRGITVSSTLQPKVPVLGRSTLDDVLTQRLLKIGRGSSMIFNMYFGEISAAELYFDAETQTIFGNSLLNYGFLKYDEITFRNFKTIFSDGGLTQPIPNSYILSSETTINDRIKHQSAMAGVAAAGIGGSSNVISSMVSGGFGLINAKKNRKWATDQSALMREFAMNAMKFEAGSSMYAKHLNNINITTKSLPYFYGQGTHTTPNRQGAVGKPTIKPLHEYTNEEAKKYDAEKEVAEAKFTKMYVDNNPKQREIMGQFRVPEFAPQDTEATIKHTEGKEGVGDEWSIEEDPTYGLGSKNRGNWERSLEHHNHKSYNREAVTALEEKTARMMRGSGAPKTYDARKGFYSAPPFPSVENGFGVPLVDMDPKKRHYKDKAGVSKWPLNQFGEEPPHDRHSNLMPSGLDAKGNVSVTDRFDELMPSGMNGAPLDRSANLMPSGMEQPDRYANLMPSGMEVDAPVDRQANLMPSGMPPVQEIQEPEEAMDYSQATPDNTNYNNVGFSYEESKA